MLKSEQMRSVFAKMMDLFAVVAVVVILLLCSHPRFSFVVIFSVSGRSSHFPSHLLYPPLVENRDAKSFCLTRAQDAAFTSSPDRLWRALPDAFKTQIQEIRDGHAAKVCVCVGGRMHWQSLSHQN